MKERLTIQNGNIEIPTILWGELNGKVIIAVHGDMSNKEDTIIELLAKNTIPNGYCVLSFDLPEHGERKNDNYECNPQNSISDLQTVYAYTKALENNISLFACSVGAYFSLLAFRDIIFERSLFLSPVVNMEHVIQDMLAGFQVSEQQLQAKKKIPLPIGKTLDWDYYSYVKQHPIDFNWKSSLAILYGAKDMLTSKEEIESFSDRQNVELTILENGEHYFHTDEQLYAFEMWLNKNL